MGKLVTFSGGLTFDENAVLFLEGERIDLASFVLSGENKNGKRVVLTYNSSVDELASYVKTLDVVCSKKIIETMDL